MDHIRSDPGASQASGGGSKRLAEALEELELRDDFSPIKKEIRPNKANALWVDQPAGTGTMQSKI